MSFTVIQKSTQQAKLININKINKTSKIPTPIKAIRKKCLDCTNGQYDEIRNCSVKKCALYPYRMGKRPNQATIDTLNEYFSENQ